MFIPKQLPAAEKHFPRKLINFKEREKIFAKTDSEKDQLKRAKKNHKTVPVRGLINDYLVSGEPILIGISHFKALK